MADGICGLSSLTGRRKSVKKGLSYKDYLQVLLFLQTEKQEKYLRMMDVIEDNIKRKVPRVLSEGLLRFL